MSPVNDFLLVVKNKGTFEDIIIRLTPKPKDALSQNSVQPVCQHQSPDVEQAFKDTFTGVLGTCIALDASCVRPQLEPVPEVYADGSLASPKQVVFGKSITELTQAVF